MSTNLRTQAVRGTYPTTRPRLRFFSQPAAEATPGLADGAPDGGAAQAAAPTPADVAARAAAANAAAVTPVTGWDGKVDSLDPAVQKIISDLRAENASARTEAKANAADEARASVVKEFGKVLGLVKDEDDPKDLDKDAVAQAVAAAKAEAKQAQQELAIFRTAQAVGADPAALLDSRAFLDTVKDIDPADEAAVKAAVQAAVTSNPRLAATPVVARSGGDLSGRSGESGTRSTPKSLAEALENAYGRNP